MARRPVTNPPGRKTSAKPVIKLRHLLLVSGLAVLCYIQTAGYSFVWDDNQQIVENTHIRSFARLPNAFQEDFWSFYGPSVHTHYYRPLQTVTYMAGYALGGQSPWPYRCLSIVLHMLASLAVVWLGWELFCSSTIALWAGLLFASHPMHTESVAWSAGITDVGCGLFYFIAVAAYLRANRCGRRWTWVAALAFLAAMLYKEMAVTLPILAFAVDGIREKSTRKKSWPERFTSWLPILLAFLVYVGLRINALGSLAIQPRELSLAAWDRILTVVYLAGLYATKLILPFGHNAYRMFEPFSRLSLGQWGPPVLVLALYAAMLWRLRDNAKIAYSGLWVLIALIPVLNLESVGQNVFAERYLYIPSAGLCLLIPALAERYARSLSVGGVQIAASAIIAGLALLTVARNPVWRDEKSFYTSTLAVSPNASMMHQNLGRVYYQEKNLSAALAEFEAARSAAGRAFIPSFSDSYNALVGISTVHADMGRLEDAWQTASEARLLDETRGEAFFILGTIRSRQQRDAEAEPLLKRAVALNPSDSAARINLGSVLLFLGKPGEAEEQFRSALAMNPDLLPGLLGLAMCHEQMGRHAEAIMMLKEVLVREPGNSVALQLLSKFNSKKILGVGPR